MNEAGLMLFPSYLTMENFVHDTSPFPQDAYRNREREQDGAQWRRAREQSPQSTPHFLPSAPALAAPGRNAWVCAVRKGRRETRPGIVAVRAGASAGGSPGPPWSAWARISVTAWVVVLRALTREGKARLLLTLGSAAVSRQ